MGLVGNKYGSQCVIKLIWLMHTWLPEGIKFSKLLRGSLILFWVDEEIFRDGLKCVTERTRGDNISCTKAAPRWPKLRYLTCDISGKVTISFIVKSEVGFTKARIIFGPKTLGQLVSYGWTTIIFPKHHQLPQVDFLGELLSLVLLIPYYWHNQRNWKNRRRGFSRG